MKIIRLEAEAFKRIRAVAIEPTGPVTVIGGRNGAGKSSVIDSICAALGGKDAAPPEPIHRGAESARIVLELDDMIVKRTFIRGGSRLDVLSKDGAKFPSPQTMLDKLVGELSFDPLRFARMEAKEQIATLRSLAGVDFAALDKQRAEAFAKRTDVNREVKRLGNLLASTPLVEGAPAEEVSVADLAKQLDERRAANAGKRAAEARLAKMRVDAEVVVKESKLKQAEIDELRAKIAALEADVGSLGATLAAIREKGKALAAEVAAMPNHDEDAIVQQMASAEAINGKARQAKARAAIADELGQQTAAEGHLTADIRAIDEAKRKMLAESKLQVPGLLFDDETGVRLNGVPFEQASSAEQLRASVAIGLAANPKLKVLLIRDGSLLDEDGLAAIAKQAADAGAQLWVERVSSSGDGCSVVIEDGGVRGSQVEEDESEIVSTTARAGFATGARQ